MVTIVGPTSSGKTSLALKLCKKHNGEIISADSRQLYKKMDIGTGKIPITNAEYVYEKKDKYWEIDGVRVYGYDLCDPNFVYSASDFKFFFEKTKNSIEKRGKRVFLVGGTGLYIDVALGNVNIANVSKNQKLREKLNTLALPDLKKMLPEDILSSMNNSDINNPRRLIRRIEILNSDDKKEVVNKSSVVSDNKIVGLRGDRKLLYKRADYWVDIIWDKLITETKFLILLGYENEATLNGIIYKTVKKLLKDEISEDESRDVIKYDLHKYIRRQQTWFNKKEGIEWFDISSDNFFNNVDKFIA